MPVSSYTLDLTNECLRCGEQPFPLPPKAFAVLRYLAEHPGRLVTKQELLDAAWPDIAVTEAVLKNAVLTVRTTLGDNAQTPRFIETVHRRGYRLLIPLPIATQLIQGSKSAIRSPQSAVGLVGRETELQQLHRWLDKALNGERQIVFVTGEPGIGKTSLVNAFLERVAAHGDAPGAEVKVRVGHGQCIEHYGTGEAYLPVLAALGQLGREPGGKGLVTVLGQHAPTWLVQMPALLSTGEFEALQRKTQGATKERMLREMAEALEVVTAERPLVLVLEDLHWSDPSTLDLLAFVARQSQPARLLLLGTYRPGEMLTAEHPLRAVVQELQLHGQCEEVPLGLLTEADTAAYLAQRTAAEAGLRPGSSSIGHVPLQQLARVIHQRTEGNPLFMVNVVNDLLAQGKLDSASVEVSVPATLRQMIERQFERLGPGDQQLLEAASVAGVEFTAAAVAAGIEATAEEVENRCAPLARRGRFLRTYGTAEWPDGTIAARYRFFHALYQEVICERVAPAQRIRLHWRIGDRLETAYGKQAGEIATELALHFEQGRDYRRAVRYLQVGGENAARRSAYQEAISHLTKGLELLKTLPDTPERVQQELTLQLALSDALITVKGYTVPEVEQTYTRARELCQQLGETPQLVPVLVRLALFYFDRGQFPMARELSGQAMRLAQSVHDPSLLPLAHMALGFTLYAVGEFTSARSHLEQAITLYDPQRHPRLTVPRSDPRVECRCFATWNLWFLGYPDQALQRLQEALILARGLAHPFSLTYGLAHAAMHHLERREWQTAQERAEEVITLSTEHGFPYFIALGKRVRGAALVMQGQEGEGIAQIQQGLAAFRAMGAVSARTVHLPWLAVAYMKVGRVEEGLAVVTEVLALVDNTGERQVEAGMYNLKGLLLLARAGENQAEAEACFRQAIDIARRRGAKSVELQAVMGLSRLWRRQGKRAEARQLLAEVYGWFTEGFDTKDLQEAKALLAKLS
jgi:DNA-binding winged helix-turn-helix (wHTH) protein/tetratricopeptide (TPR) repeat protein